MPAMCRGYVQRISKLTIGIVSVDCTDTFISKMQPYSQNKCYVKLQGDLIGEMSDQFRFWQWRPRDISWLGLERSLNSQTREDESRWKYPRAAEQRISVYLFNASYTDTWTIWQIRTSFNTNRWPFYCDSWWNSKTPMKTENCRNF